MALPTISNKHNQSISKIYDEETVKLRELLKEKDETIKNMNSENKILKDKLSRIKIKMKIFIKNYKIIEKKLNQMTNDKVMSISDELKKAYLSSDSIDLCRTKSGNHLSKSSCNIEDNSFINHNDLSNTIHITEGDLSTDYKPNPGKSRNANKNEEFSFRSTDILPQLKSTNHFETEKTNNKHESNEDLNNKLNIIKIKTKNLIDTYQNLLRVKCN